mmetsp:Transcript_7958/g.11197  ORF Transcript_7958/g.11197 Transcript_7958/m.11197 type:complete len:585 (+) Transcript_7958:217-1971(+)
MTDTLPTITTPQPQPPYNLPSSSPSSSMMMHSHPMNTRRSNTTIATNTPSTTSSIAASTDEEEEDDDDVIHIVPPPAPSSSSYLVPPAIFQRNSEEEDEDEEKKRDASYHAAKMTYENNECPHVACMVPTFLGFGPFLKKRRRQRRRRRDEELKVNAIASLYYSTLFQDNAGDHHSHVVHRGKQTISSRNVVKKDGEEIIPEEQQTTIPKRKTFFEQQEENLTSMMYGGGANMPYRSLVPPRCFPYLRDDAAPPCTEDTTMLVPPNSDKVAIKEDADEDDDDDEEMGNQRRSSRKKRKATSDHYYYDEEDMLGEDETKNASTVDKPTTKAKFKFSNNRFEELYQLEQALKKGERIHLEEEEDTEEEDDENASLEEQERCTQNMALASSRKMEEYCEVLRTTRHLYWDHFFSYSSSSSSSSSLKKSNFTKEVSSTFGWGGISDDPTTCTKQHKEEKENASLWNCMWCHHPSPFQPPRCQSASSSSRRRTLSHQKIVRKRTVPSDDIMKCLECSVTGCGPSFLSPKKKGEKEESSQHMFCHFIASGHSFGKTITCFYLMSRRLLLGERESLIRRGLCYVFWFHKQN